MHDVEMYDFPKHSSRVIKMMLLLALIVCTTSNRIIGQLATAPGSTILEAYLDKNNDYMWKTGFFTKQEADMFQYDALVALSGVVRINFLNCPRDSSGIGRCDGWLLFPLAASYSIIGDTKYPDRPGNWIAVEFGFMAINPSGILADASRLVYFNSKNMTEREVMTTYTMSLCVTSNVTAIVGLDAGKIVGEARTIYKLADGKVSIASILNLKE